MLVKRFRLVLDVDVQIDEISEDNAARRRLERRALQRKLNPTFPCAPVVIPSAQQLAVQQLLLERLIDNPDLLDTYLKREVVEHVRDGGLEDIYEFGCEEDSIVPRVLDRMLPDSRTLFPSSDRDDLGDEFDEFYDSFTPRVRNGWIFERPPDAPSLTA